MSIAFKWQPVAFNDENAESVIGGRKRVYFHCVPIVEGPSVPAPNRPALAPGTRLVKRRSSHA